MVCPLRIECEGAVSRDGAGRRARADRFLDDDDRQAFIANLGRLCDRFHGRAWCLLSHHDHLLIETLEPTLSRGMNQAIRRAYASKAYSLTEIARHFGVHVATASRIARGVGYAKGKT